MCPYRSMQHYNSLNGLKLQNTWLTIGIFDGLHAGHQVLLRRLVDGAHAGGCQAVVLTFTPHPAIVLGGRSDFKCLTTPAERLALLGSLGLDAVITQAFDRAFAEQSAGEFMQHISPALGLRRLILGYDTALGRGREGDAARLAELGLGLGYTVETVPPLRHGEAVLSSSAIRAWIREGALAEAAAGLGRWYGLSGTVVHGDGRGRHINLPTANLEFPADKLLPPQGIYATWAWTAGERFPAATNIGINPTFTPSKQAASVEAHLLDFHRDLYGQEIRIEFVARLRDEVKFPSVEALLGQIQVDIEQTRLILAAAG